MNNLFGTDGIRCAVGTFPLTPDGMPKLGQAIGTWLKRKYIHTPKILIAEDSRLSGSFLKHSLASGLLRYPIKIYDSGTLTTPAIFQLVQKQQLFDCGIIITASHNEYLDNGIKIITRTTGRLLEKDERAIKEILLQKDFHPINYKLLGSTSYFFDAKEKYKACLKNYFKSKFLDGITIALDCANGATSQFAPEIFEELGARVITTQNHPNGKNINFECGSVHPENIQSFVKTKKANIGFAFDGDGDRLTIVNKNGQILDGDDIITLLLEHESVQKEKAVVSTIMSNQGLIDYLESKKIGHIASQVGEKSVVMQLVREGLILGGEPSGHIVMRDYLSSSDAIFIALRVIETIKQNGNWDLVTFKKYPQVLINLPIKIKQNLKNEPFNNLIEKYSNMLKPGRILARYSGTENILRVMVESKNSTAKELANSFIKEYKELEKFNKGPIREKRQCVEKSI